MDAKNFFISAAFFKQERLDKNQYQFNILVPIHAMDESLGSVNGRVRKLVGLVPVPVQVLVEMSLDFIFFVRTKKGCVCPLQLPSILSLV
jgi:hypothetical protein